MPSRVRTERLCCGGSGPSRARSPGCHAPQQVPMHDRSVRRSHDCGASQGCHCAARVPERVRSRAGRTGGDRRQEPEFGGAPQHRQSGHPIRAASKMKCCGESSYASVKPEPSEPPQHKNVRNMFFEMLRATFKKQVGTAPTDEVPCFVSLDPSETHVRNPQFRTPSLCKRMSGFERGPPGRACGRRT